MSRLSDLEQAVLGLVWKTGPCTPYSIRQCFLRSPSPDWSGSAGAIYPLVSRLEERGLLRSRAADTGRRPRRDYRITAAGRRALRAWLQPPLPPEAAATSHDPLRTRMLFLDALEPAERRAFLDEARTRLDEHLAVVRADLTRRRREGDVHGALAARGALLVGRARLSWLAEVRTKLDGESR